MYAIEFEADIQDGVVRIPDEYRQLKNSHARIVVMVKEELAADLNESPLDLSDCQIQAFRETDALEIQREMRDEW